MDITKIISENLTAWMAETPALDTFKKVAERSGVGFGTVQRARNGDGNITVEKLAAISKAFGRKPAELITPLPMERSAAAVPTQPRRRATSGSTNSREERIAALNFLLARTNEYGLVAMLEKAKDVARDYPLDDSQPKGKEAMEAPFAK